MLSKSRIKQINALHLKKGREDAGMYLVEGVKQVKELIMQRPDLIVEVFGTSVFISDNLHLMDSRDVAYQEVSEEELNKISGLTTPNQVLAVCKKASGMPVEFDPEKEIAIYLDDIRDPGNLGTIIRLADWFGVSNVFCSEDTCELYNPKVIQSTMGAFMRVNVQYCSLSAVIDKYRVNRVYGAVLNGNDLYEQQLEPGLVVIGNESLGIRAQNITRVNQPITIPAHGKNGTESLNAAMACSVIVSEFFRQLRLKN